MSKQCEWCEKQTSYKNYARHITKCVFRNEVLLHKSELEKLKALVPKNDPIIEAVLMELKHFLTESYFKTSNLYKRFIQEDGRDPVEKIKEMIVSPQTLENYLSEWKLFSKWLKKNNKTMSVDSANSYIASLSDYKASTQRRKQYMLQVILQHLIDRTVKLNRFSKRISYTPKFPMSDEELNRYLEEQREINYEDYLIQRLMSTYGLRINTIALLKVENLVLESREV